MEPNIGVFLCDCGNVISRILNFEVLKEYTQSIPSVFFVSRNGAYCSETGIRIMLDEIKRKRINRVVIAACSPKICELFFSTSIEKVGLNPYCLEIVNLREQVVWPHLDETERATEKAKSLIYAAVERVKLLEPIESIEIPIKKTALIIGGGIAGIQSAIDLTDMNFKVYLVERKPYLGGFAASLGKVFPTDDCALCVICPASNPRTKSTPRKCLYRAGLSEIPNLNIITNAKIIDIKGEIGNFHVTIEKRPRYVNEKKCIRCQLCEAVCPVKVPDEFYPMLTVRKAIYMPSPQVHPAVYTIDDRFCEFEKCNLCAEICPMDAIEFDQKPVEITFEVGTILISTGFEEYDPSPIKEYGYGVYKNVVTQLQLAKMLNIVSLTGGMPIRPSDNKEAKKIVMIQCVGSRDERTNEYCSGICCMIALKHAQIIKTRNPNAEVYICYIDIRTTGKGHEAYYKKARELGVVFIKGKPSGIFKDPETKNLVIEVEDASLGRPIELDADLVVLSTAFVPAKGTEELAKMLGIKTGTDGFFKELYPKLRVAETEVEGVFICGGAQGPKDIPTTSMHASAATLKASKLMFTGKVVKDRLTAVIDENYCDACGFCAAVCPYNAIEIDEGNSIAQVMDSKCQGCGICVAACPADIIQLRHWRDSQILAQIEGLFKFSSKHQKNPQPSIIAFCCDECGYAAADSAGFLRMQYPVNIKILRVPCIGRVAISHILKAFNAGADAIMLVGCKKDGCHYINGNITAERRVKLTKKLLSQMGIEPERLEIFFVPCIEADKFVEATELMMNRISHLGHKIPLLIDG